MLRESSSSLSPFRAVSERTQMVTRNVSDARKTDTALESCDGVRRGICAAQARTEVLR